MKRLLWLTVAAFLLIGLRTYAELANTYQVTGPILELTENRIVVQKGDERWELARDPSTKIKGELKIGHKVTIYYRMIATRVEVSPAEVPPLKNPTVPKKK